jgi:putative FmdB family regulatory protein
MPLYVYSCKECEKIYEVIVSLDRYDKKIKCPHCKRMLLKLFTPCYIKVN